MKVLTEEPGLYGIGEVSSLELDDQVEGVLHWWAENYLVGKDPLDQEVHWTRAIAAQASTNLGVPINVLNITSGDGLDTVTH